MEQVREIGDNRDNDLSRPKEADATSTAEALMTAEEFGQRPDPGHPEELVQGRIISMPPPDRRHGFVCCQVSFLLRQFLSEHDLGRVMTNDSGVITEQGPELVVEVRSPGDRWRPIHEKVTEYLRAGILVVIVLDPEPQTAHIFGADDAPRTLGVEDELTLPGILEGFRVRVERFSDRTSDTKP
jgi:Uma2 family endonuclease